MATPGRLEDHIASEVGELLKVVAREVTLEVTRPEGLIIGALSPYAVQRAAATRCCSAI
jgi:hypothetical protein